ncbi:hypothetical protein Sphch_3143 [Sphingobium chlorophenolicum L-1]|uniref:Uncharacterized protein n=1 Tax=Sphingobium chlorophenolicum L-1 TaxID=690566 RepID=F6F2U6_SPHCR|nr:hypothetical protein Sphch_3143 [Sphingobium chlorophenolicum L-1]
MQMAANTVLQFCLPFEGVQDRVREAAEAGNVLFMAHARLAMARYDISDILVIRSLKRCQLVGRAQQGNSRGEWRCSVCFKNRGFRTGGAISIAVVEGRVFVEDIRWDQSHD